MNVYDLEGLPSVDELTSVLTKNNNVRIERIVSTGQISHWYDQSETEFVLLLQGNAIIEFDDATTIELNKGDTLLIKPHQKHKVSYTSKNPPCIWICVFFN